MSVLRDGLLVGRDGEVSLLRGLVAAVRSGRGGIALIEGEPGIGKTALLAEVARRASAAGVPALWISGVPGTEPDLRDRTRPVLVVFDDLHAADDATLDLWRRLAAATEDSPTLVVGARRLVPRRPSVDRLREGAVVIPLSGLDPEHVAALAGPDDRDRLQAAGGNPRYIRELMEGPTLAGPVAEKLGYLTPRTLEVLHGAALLGDPFSVADLSLITAFSPIELVPVIDEALAAGLIEPAEHQLRFRHAAIRRALYDATPPERRTALHLVTAWVLMATGAQPERVARHLLDSGDSPSEAWEADWLAAHAETLMRREPGTAAAILERVLHGLDPADPRRAEFEDSLADADFRLFRFEAAARIARQNIARSTDPERIGRNTWLLGYSLLRLRRLDDVLRELDEASARPGVTERWLARYAALRAVAFGGCEQLERARDAARDALAAGRRAQDPMAIGYALHAQSYVTIAADHDDAAAATLIDRAMAVVLDDPNLFDLRLLLWCNRLAVGFEVGDPAEELMDWARQMLVTAETSGLPRLNTLRLLVAEVAFELGLWDEATDILDLISDHEIATAATRHAILAQLAARRDDPEQARQALTTMREAWATGAQTEYGRVFTLAAEAFEHERECAPEAALEMLAVCLRLGRPNHPLRYRLLPALSRLALAGGDKALALDAARAAETDAGAGSITRRRATDLWCRGLLDADPAPILEAADLLREAGLLPAHGNALEDAAELFARARDTSRARTTLVEALDVYEELGAAWDARRATSRLRANGVRLRTVAGGRRAVSGPESLTETERKVADLVAEGLSNPDIADRLNLSRRTVESHVSRILAKLGAASRVEVKNHLA
ncbi:AAA family ATPase [Actinospica sp. MGRD01-02]|uniref:AAA family ATPase n=1 Tax=Actinospica acidithermotolerans TaxID=2828514 RepID=A0A941EF42_9ACTN|nr:LuxR family transcriptional regulator [Actinospica acidithermotolerans]MBR7829390.1 AAA family ATPase [Actinospica acidithermotolerans]